MSNVAERILKLAEAQGFALAGLASAEPSEHADAVRDWVAEGKHGTMDWFANHLEIRVDVQRLLPGAQSVIVVCDAYAGGKGPRGRGAEGPSEDEAGGAEGSHLAPRPLGPSTPAPKGRIARYAWGDDYHKVLKKRLHTLANTLADQHPGESFRVAVDTAPALERELAARAGLGWQAKNTMLIHPRHGSYTLLGLVVTTLGVEGPRGRGAEGPSESQAEMLDGSHSAPGPLGPSAPSPAAFGGCANCTRCIDACPTNAIAPKGYSLDASRCVSYLTIEHRGIVPEDLHSGFRGWIAGCDICQEVCPYNVIGQRPRNVLPVPPEYDPGSRKFDEGLDLLEVLSWTAEDRTRVFRGSALKRIKLDMIRRNALIAIGNVLAEREDAALRNAVRGCLDDESELVAATARQVWSRISDSPV